MVETQCGMCYGAIKAISDARNTHMDNSVLKVGREGEGAQMSLLDTFWYDDNFPCVQIDVNIMNILKWICKPYKDPVLVRTMIMLHFSPKKQPKLEQNSSRRIIIVSYWISPT